MPDGQRYQNPKRARQLLSGRGMWFKTISPSDIDQIIEFRGRAFVFNELKYNGKGVKAGQRILLENLVKSNKCSAIAIVADHYDPSDGEIDESVAMVREFYWYRHNRWEAPPFPMTLRECVERFLLHEGLSEYFQ